MRGSRGSFQGGRGGIRPAFSDRDSFKNERFFPRRTELTANAGDSLYFGNLSHSAKESDVEALVSKYGKAIQCVITRDKDFISKGYGFVRMENDMSADDCVKNLNGSTFFGKKIIVEKSRRTSEKYYTGHPPRAGDRVPPRQIDSRPPPPRDFDYRSDRPKSYDPQKTGEYDRSRDTRRENNKDRDGGYYYEDERRGYGEGASSSSYPSSYDSNRVRRDFPDNNRDAPSDRNYADWDRKGAPPVSSTGGYSDRDYGRGGASYDAKSGGSYSSDRYSDWDRGTGSGGAPSASSGSSRYADESYGSKYGSSNASETSRSYSDLYPSHSSDSSYDPQSRPVDQTRYEAGSSGTGSSGAYYSRSRSGSGSGSGNYPETYSPGGDVAAAAAAVSSAYEIYGSRMQGGYGDSSSSSATSSGYSSSSSSSSSYSSGSSGYSSGSSSGYSSSYPGQSTTSSGSSSSSYPSSDYDYRRDGAPYDSRDAERIRSGSSGSAGGYDRSRSLAGYPDDPKNSQYRDKDPRSSGSMRGMTARGDGWRGPGGSAPPAGSGGAASAAPAPGYSREPLSSKAAPPRYDPYRR